VIEEISGASIIEGVSLGTIKIIDKELLIITSFAFLSYSYIEIKIRDADEKLKRERERERERESKEN